MRKRTKAMRCFSACLSAALLLQTGIGTPQNTWAATAAVQEGAAGRAAESEAPPLEELLAHLLQQDVEADASYEQIVLPDTGYEGYSLALYATSNPAVISMDGRITRPLEDMKVNLFYELQGPDGTVLQGDEPKTVLIEGLYTPEESENEKPDVVPEL